MSWLAHVDFDHYPWWLSAKGQGFRERRRGKNEKWNWALEGNKILLISWASCSFFPSGYVHIAFHLKACVSKLSHPSLSQSTSDQNTNRYFPRFSLPDAALHKERPGKSFSLISSPLAKYPILPLITSSSCRRCLVLLQGLVGKYSARLPFLHDVISLWQQDL